MSFGSTALRRVLPNTQPRELEVVFPYRKKARVLTTQQNRAPKLILQL